MRPTVKFNQIEVFANKTLDILLGISVDEGVVLILMGLKTSAISILLNPLVAVNRPQLVIVARAGPGGGRIGCNLLFFPSQYALNCVHGHQILTVPVVNQSIFLHSCTNFVVGFAVERNEELKPVFDQLVAFFCSDEVVFIG